MTEAFTPDAATRNELIGLVPELRAFAISLSRNPSTADDLVQETVLKAWSKLDSFEPGTNMRAWLFTILRNTFYSNARKGKREVADVDGAYAARLSQKPDHDGRLAMRDFATAFATLPDEQREALILIGAWLLDQGLGEPYRYHPLNGFARLAGRLEGRLNRRDLAPAARRRARPPPLPRALPISAATCHRPLARLKTVRWMRFMVCSPVQFEPRRGRRRQPLEFTSLLSRLAVAAFQEADRGLLVPDL